MALVPKKDDVEYRLNHLVVKNLPRDYLGLSQIGNKCHRFLQYYHYWAFESEIDNRISRLFGFGHMMEQQMINDLADIEIFVSGEQKEVVGAGGHWKGHCDGEAISASDIDQKFLVEFKTHNDKNFKALKKDGVRKAYPGHYGQCMSYMGYLELPFCFYLAYNKNDSEYYYEIIYFDEEAFSEYKRKEVEIITSDALLPRIGNNTASWFECKMCDARSTCFGRTAIPITCRTCKNVDVLDEGNWACTIKADFINPILSSEEQRAACDEYQLGDMFK